MSTLAKALLMAAGSRSRRIASNLTLRGHRDTASYVQYDADFGPPSSTRVIAVCCINSHGSQVTAVTIGGVTAIKAAGINSGFEDASVWYAEVPTGTSGYIAINAAAASFSFCWYSFDATDSTPIDTAEQDNGTIENASVSLDSRGKGVVIYVLCVYHGEAWDDPTWSGTSIPHIDQKMESGGDPGRGHAGSMSVDAGDTVTGGTFAVAGIETFMAFAAASWA